MRVLHWLVIPLLLSTGCVAAGNPIPVRGDAEALAGEWNGEYISPGTGRSGSIHFRLTAGTDTARGDVLMTPRGNGPSAVPQSYPHQGSGESPRPLQIELVRVFGHQVAGQMTPYRDPECDCVVTTIFSGRLEGNELEGVFYIYRPNGPTSSGEWRVKRSERRGER